MANATDALFLETLMGKDTTAAPAESPIPVQGIGGGLADQVPATIEGEQPAALSEGEFVWPADVVSFMGNGSSEAGARVLNGVISEVRRLMQNGDEKQTEGLAKKVSQSLAE